MHCGPAGATAAAPAGLAEMEAAEPGAAAAEAVEAVGAVEEAAMAEAQTEAATAFSVELRPRVTPNPRLVYQTQWALAVESKRDLLAAGMPCPYLAGAAGQAWLDV